MADGIFCLETATWDDLAKGQTSYEHFLRFLETSTNGGPPYRHYDVATKEEFEFYLDAWKKKKMRNRFPFLLFAFHGDEKGLGLLGEGEGVSTDEIVGYLSSNDFNDTFIHFSSCYYLDKDKAEELLYRTGALSVSGYRNKEGVDWYPPVAFELLFLATLFELAYPRRKRKGLPNVSTSMRDFLENNHAKNTAMATLGRKLDFHLWYCIDDARTKAAHPPNIHAVLLKDLKEKYGGAGTY